MTNRLTQIVKTILSQPNPTSAAKEAFPATSQPTYAAILNITPDSFSDGGELIDPKVALERAKKLVEAGAGILDVGAESTRPGAKPLTADEEWQRLEPILVPLTEEYKNTEIKISVDTYHPETAQKAISLGVGLINDVTGGDNPEMVKVIANSDVKYVFMHHLSIPEDRSNLLPEECDPVAEVLAWGKQRAEELEQQGIDRSQLIFDPGIGFGKEAKQSWQLLEQINAFHELELPLFVGHSRKSFLSLITDAPFAERDLETAVLSEYLASKGVAFLRVHEVAVTGNG